MITIDGHTYNLPIISIERDFNALDKSAERTQDGVLHREVIGVFYNYSVTFGMSVSNVSEYAALYNVVSNASGFHSVIIPGENGGAAWQAYISNGKDTIARLQKDGVNYYRALAFSIIARAPHRTP